MAEIRRIAKSVADTATLMDELETDLAAAGWVLHDDQWNGTTGYHVWASMGRAADRCPITAYVKIEKGTNFLNINRYAYWNNSTQTGIAYVNTGINALGVDDDASFYYWLYATEDFIILLSKVGATYDQFAVMRFTPAYRAIGRLQSGVSSGSGVTLQLGAGEAANFFIGSQCVVFDAQNSSWNGRQYDCAFDSIDYQNDQLVITTLDIDLQEGAIVSYLSDWWVVIFNGITCYMFGCDASTVSGTGNSTASDSMRLHIGTQYFDPDNQAGSGAPDLWGFSISMVPRNNSGLNGYFDRQFQPISDDTDYTSNEDTLPVGIRVVENQATGGAVGYVENTALTWTLNEWADKVVIITQGTGAGQMRKISSNTTGGRIVPTENFTTAPDNSSYFLVCEEGWRVFGVMSTSGHVHAVKEWPSFDQFTSYLVTTTTTTTTTTS
jgi:hypothetical protein